MALATLAGCRGQLTDQGGFVGSVVDLRLPSQSPEQAGMVHVKESATDQCGIVFGVTSATVVLRQVGTRTQAAALTDLAVGQHVRVELSGPVLESCPARSSTTRIVMIP